MPTFQAELKEVKSTKTLSLDKEIKVVLVTTDLEALQLASDDPETIYQVTIERQK